MAGKAGREDEKGVEQIENFVRRNRRDRSRGGNKTSVDGITEQTGLYASPKSQFSQLFAPRRTFPPAPFNDFGVPKVDAGPGGRLKIIIKP